MKKVWDAQKKSTEWEKKDPIVRIWRLQWHIRISPYIVMELDIICHFPILQKLFFLKM